MNYSRSRENVIWLSGLMEGEGSFGWHQIKRRPGTSGIPLVQLKMTDEDVVQRAAELFRKPLHQYGVTSTGKKVWAICFNGKDAVGWMMTMYPWLGDRRRERIRGIVDRWRAVPNKSGPRGRSNRPRIGPPNPTAGVK